MASPLEYFYRGVPVAPTSTAGDFSHAYRGGFAGTSFQSSAPPPPSFSISENWDSVIDPSIPSDWNADAGLATSAGVYYSSPNSLYLGSLGLNFAVNSSADSGGGQIVDIHSNVNIGTSPGTGDYSMGPVFRCSGTSMSGGSCYWVNLRCQNNMATVDLRFSSILSGTRSDIATLHCGSGEFASGSWYVIRVYMLSLNTFNVSVLRTSDGWMLNSSGVFQSSAAVAISSLVDSSVATAPYYGLAASQSGVGANIYMDDYSVSSSFTATVYPRRPVIARVPFQFYIVD